MNATGVAGLPRERDLGSVTVLVGLIVIWIVFQLTSPTFLTPTNLVNLTLQSAAIGTMALGLVVVLLVGQIDLSVGSVSGLSAAIVGVTFVQQRWPLWLAILAALAVGALIGLLYGLLYTRFGVPSFVITMAGLLGFLGLQLYVLGPTGSLNIPFDTPLVAFAQQMFVPSWLSYTILAISSAAWALVAWTQASRRKNAGLAFQSNASIILRVAALVALGSVAIWYLGQARGIGVMVVVFIALVIGTDFALKRTRWGRNVFATGGNVEATRRAGISVNRVYISVFMFCSTLAAVGGLMAAGRLAAANQSSGGGDTNLNAIAAAVIGGTSLFGGRGSAYSAFLGVLVIQSISSGLSLLNLSSSIRYMITGAVLLAAVIVDSVARRSRQAHGLA